ncbi:hypothetical protein [Pseudomonas entomophila]|uniref:hypothetical protein n=1 Tax=Pseudomonas entomophila TaxID=312306 RepID=UPI003EB92991
MGNALPPVRQSVYSHGLICLVISLFTVLFIEVVSGRAHVWLGVWPDYEDMRLHINEPLGRLRWFLSDLSGATFHKHELASLGLVCGGALAHWAYQRAKAWQGFALCHGHGRWWWVVASSVVSLLLSHALWGWTLQAGAWQPTYVAFVSVPAMLVMSFGTGWRVLLGGAMLGALLVTPTSLLLFNVLCVPLDLPSITGSMLGVALSCALVSRLCTHCPHWFGRRQSPLTSRPSTIDAGRGPVWVLRRVLADFSEVTFFGNEWASLGLLGGLLLAYLLSPASPAYGSHLVPELIAGQALASWLGILIWRRHWIGLGWYPTYLPIVSIVPVALLTYGGQLNVILLSALLGAAVLPPLAIAITLRLPDDMHVHVGCTLAMALGTLVLNPLIGLLIGPSAF